MKKPVLGASRRLFVACSLLLVGLLFWGLRVVGAPDSASPKPSPSNVITLQRHPGHFIAFGDSGSGLSGQYRLAVRMVEAYQKEPFDFALMLGDNIYPIGDVKTYGESRFQKPYQPLLSQGVRFYPVLGNHDTAAGFTKAALAFFNMPSRYYQFDKGTGEARVAFFAIDTNAFNATQQAWLRRELAKSTARWKIVYGHHPVFSSGDHGNSRALIRDLKPILEAGGADLYLAGHDHNYERLAPVHGVTYVVSGGGGASLRPFKDIVPGSLVRQSTFHFLRFHATAEGLTYEAIDAEGKVIDRLTLEPNQTRQTPALKPAA